MKALAPKNFTDQERSLIGWVLADVARARGLEGRCHTCQSFCFRDAEKTKIDNSGSFGHLLPCCQILEATGGCVRATASTGCCDHWVCRK